MYLGAFVLGLIWALLRRRCRAAEPQPDRPRLELATRPIVVPLAALGLVLLFLAQLAVVTMMARHQNAPPCWLRFPVPVLADLDEGSGGLAQPGPSLALAALALAQSALLLVFYAAARDRTASRLVLGSVACACATMLAAAMLVPVLTSPDVFLYITFAKLGFASFAAEPHVVATDLPLADWCLSRVLPSAYGPAFIGYIHLLAGASRAPIVHILIMRAANAAWFLALLGLLRAARVAPMAIALLALGPVLPFQYVVNAHNDLIPVVLVVAALATRSTPLRFLAVVAAALVKLPFALIGALAFAREGAPPRRFALAASAFALSVALSYALAGPAYFAALSYYGRLLASSVDRLEYLAAAVALGAIAVALARRRYAFVATYALPALPVQSLMPWYALWSLPYAVEERAHLIAYAVLLPVAGFLLETGVAHVAQGAVYGLVCAVIAVGIVRDVAAAHRRPAG